MSRQKRRVRVPTFGVEPRWLLGDAFVFALNLTKANQRSLQTATDPNVATPAFVSMAMPPWTPAEAAVFKVERARLLSVADAAPRREYYRHHVELVRAQSH